MDEGEPFPVAVDLTNTANSEIVGDDEHNDDFNQQRSETNSCVDDQIVPETDPDLETGSARGTLSREDYAELRVDVGELHNLPVHNIRTLPRERPVAAITNQPNPKRKSSVSLCYSYVYPALTQIVNHI